MKIRPWAQFDSSLPYDAIEDDNGFVQWPARNVAVAVQEVLLGLGCAPGEIFNLEHAGWEFEFKYGRATIACRVTMIDEYLVTFYDGSFFGSLFKRTPPGMVEALRKIGDALAQDPRFLNVRWFSDEEVETDAAGAPRPVGE